MNGQHTRGPWSVDVRYDVYAGDPATGSRIDVASLYWCGGLKHNARLIAAAPELLAALKAVVAVADRDTDEFNNAREVIHRAEGGE